MGDRTERTFRGVAHAGGGREYCPRAVEAASPGPGFHLQSEASTQAESRSARGEPETHPRLNAKRAASSGTLGETTQGREGRYRLRRSAGLRGLYGPLQAGTAHIDVLGVAVLGQEAEQRPHVQVVVIVDVTEPPATRTTPSQPRAPARARGYACTSVFPHFLPDLMKVSYSSAILQDSAWRL